MHHYCNFLFQSGGDRAETSVQVTGQPQEAGAGDAGVLPDQVLIDCGRYATVLYLIK